MASDELVSPLAAHTVVGAAPRAELEWLAAHGQMRTLEAGEILSRPSEPVRGLYIILSGAVAVFVARAGVREKVSEWRGGEVDDRNHEGQFRIPFAGSFPRCRKAGRSGCSRSGRTRRIEAVLMSPMRHEADQIHGSGSVAAVPPSPEPGVFSGQHGHG